MQYLLYILTIPFLYINYKIIVSDLKNKIIPNKYLGYLLLLIPFYYIYIFFSFTEINYLLFILQIILTFIISFILYYFWIWAAWDAKYLLTLALFIPYIGIIPFIWNIALITIFYLLWYFIWFYFWKSIFIKWYAKTLYKQIKIDLNEKWTVYKWTKSWKNIFIILRWLIVFLILFVSIRLSRIYLFNNIFEKETIIINFIEKYNIYIIIIFIILFVLILYLIKILLNKIKFFIHKKFNLNIEKISNYLLFILFLILITFIIFEYNINSDKIKNLLFLVFTLYLSIRIIFIILTYSYKITFWINEIEYKNIENLKKWDIIDKVSLIKMFWNQVILWAKWQMQNKKWILYPDPIKKIMDIENPISNETISLIKQIYKDTNNFHKSNNNTIKIVNTFPFSPYILLWFIITYIYNTDIYIFIIEQIINLSKNNL